MQETLLRLVNEFLTSKGRENVGVKDTLHSSGLLDSMDMLELMLFLNVHGYLLLLGTTGARFNLNEMDSVENMLQITKIKS